MCKIIFRWLGTQMWAPNYLKPIDLQKMLPIAFCGGQDD